MLLKNIALVSLLTFSLVPQDVVAEGECANQKAKEFVAAYSELLPQTYEGIVKLPLTIRRALVNELSYHAQSVLWRTQFQRYIDAELEHDQRQVLEDAIRMVSPEWFGLMRRKTGGARYERSLQALQDLETRAIEAFGKDKTRKIFAQLGGPAIDELFLNEVFTNSDPICSCSILSDYCGRRADCGDAGNCEETDGCGFLGAYTCTGLCYSVE